MIGEPFCPECAPVVWCHLIQRIYDVIEGIGFYQRSPTLATVKELTEVVDGLLIIGLLPDNHVDPEPVQHVFIVVVESAPPGLPLVRRSLHGGHTIGGVLQISPRSAGSVIESRRQDGNGIAKLLWRAQAAAAGKNVA